MESLPPGKTLWDGEVRGFGVRRQSRDAFYVVKYRDLGGHQRFVTIGRHGDGEWTPSKARGEAIRLKGLVRDGRDPATARDERKATPTLAEFADRYMRELTPRATISRAPKRTTRAVWRASSNRRWARSG